MEFTERPEGEEKKRPAAPSEPAETTADALPDGEADAADCTTQASAETEVKRKKKRVCPRLTRGQPPKLDKRSVAWMLLITLVYAMLAFFRLNLPLVVLVATCVSYGAFWLFG